LYQGFDCRLFPFSALNKVYLLSGRNALWHAIPVLGIKNDAEILVPSYNCGAEIDPIVKQGCGVQLYKVNTDLSIDTENLKKKIAHRTKAVLVIHYFGFPQPVDLIRDICNEHGLYLIEDCSHALFSMYCNRPLGSFGDVAVFSMRKFLPVPDGGILVINNSALQLPEGLRPPTFKYEMHKRALQFILKMTGIDNRLLLLLYDFISRSFLRHEVPNGWPNAADENLPARWYNYRIDSSTVNRTISKTTLSVLGKIAKDELMEEIIRRRRSNFLFAVEETKNSNSATPVFDSLPEGICPSTFPVLVKERKEKHKLLLRKGIFCLKTWPVFYPGMPWGQFPEAVFLKKHIISIPIKQDFKKQRFHEVMNWLKD